VLRKVFTILAAVLLAVYVTVSTAMLTRTTPDEGLCQGLEVRTHDSLDYGLLDSLSVRSMLDRNSLNPTGKPMNSVNTLAMERLLESHPLVASAECYRTAGGFVKIRIVCRTPVFRVLSQDGADYYVDSHGEIIERLPSVIDLPVVTGVVTRGYACNEILGLMEAIERSPFWKAQIEQVHVTSTGEVQMVPRVGAHLLEIGTPADAAEKLDRLYAFYTEGLNEIGWDKYSRISVAYDGQVVCRKH